MNKLDENRKYLYKLENSGILKLNRSVNKKGFYKFEWKLTKKGKELINKNQKLRSLFNKNKFKQFYEEFE